MARQLGLSERYLTRCFHKEMHITPVEYLNRYRLKKAKAILRTGANVTETAVLAIWVIRPDLRGKTD